MIRAYTVGQVRAAEAVRLAQVADGALMQRAAAALAATCARLLRERGGRVGGSGVLLLVGAGNNGGDALWAGERLARRGARVLAVLTARSVHAEGLAALRAAGGRAVRAEELPDLSRTGLVRAGLPRIDLVVDGLVGLGGAPGLREPAASLVARLGPVGGSGDDAGTRTTAGAAGPGNGPDRRRPVVVAVDLPSGVDPDTGGTPGPHVVADVTVTFGAAKPCLLLPPASRAAGRVVEVDLGLGDLLTGPAAVERLGPDDAAARWPVPGPQDDKYRRGVVGIVAGSAAYPGAAVLACAGALRAGTGMVRYQGPGPAADQVRAHWPEVVVGPGRVQAWVLGSGVDPGPDDGQAEAIADALRGGLPCVLDAGALQLLAERPALRAHLGPHVLLTPHAGELARLLTALDAAGPGDGGGDRGGVDRAEVEADPPAHARRVAELTGATVLLKGSTTLVTGPSGPVRSQADAPAWLATAGAGDVLAGIAGALLAAGLEPLDAGSLAALVHGRAAAAARPGGPVTAGDVAAAVPEVVAALLGAGPGPAGHPRSPAGHAVQRIGRPARFGDAPARRRDRLWDTDR